jgi:hypothetical protein
MIPFRIHDLRTNENGFCCNATALILLLLTDRRSHCQQQPGLGGDSAHEYWTTMEATYELSSLAADVRDASPTLARLASGNAQRCIHDGFNGPVRIFDHVPNDDAATAGSHAADGRGIRGAANRRQADLAQLPSAQRDLHRSAILFRTRRDGITETRSRKDASEDYVARLYLGTRPEDADFVSFTKNERYPRTITWISEHRATRQQ